MMVARRHGAAMLLNLLLKCRPSSALTSSIACANAARARRSRRAHRPEWRPCPCSPSPERLRSAARSAGSATARSAAPAQPPRTSRWRLTSSEVLLMLAAGAMITASGMVSITAIHSEPARMAGRKRHAVGSSGIVSYDLGTALPCSRLRRQMREIGLPIVGPASSDTEFARTIRMNEIVAGPVDEVDRIARPCRRPDAIERAPHVDIDHENAERLAVARDDRRPDANRRSVHLLDHSVEAPRSSGETKVCVGSSRIVSWK